MQIYTGRRIDMKRLLHIQSQLVAPKSQYNDFGKFKYRNIEDILGALKPLLLETQTVLVCSDTIEMIGTRYYVKTQAELKGMDGVRIDHAYGYAREEETKKGMDSSQITGTAGTYAKKRSLESLFLCDDTRDADSNGVKQPSSNVPQPAPTAAAPTKAPAAPAKGGKKFLTCPKCGVDAVIKGKEEYGGGYVCWTKQQGCNEKFTDAQFEQAPPQVTAPKKDTNNEVWNRFSADFDALLDKQGIGTGTRQFIASYVSQRALATEKSEDEKKVEAIKNPKKFFEAFGLYMNEMGNAEPPADHPDDVGPLHDRGAIELEGI
jgi:hypothetical protein